ncbi:MAG: hypothetical protein COC15_03445 [Legionellales bacterium]|nr:MAG: hypothetical protein COC15_03445 [Legionellales bacterium]
MPKIVLITGATGLLGCHLAKSLHLLDEYHVISHGFSSAADVQFDLTDARDTSNNLVKICPDIIINLVACTDVDKCEFNPNLAYNLNVKTVENIVNCIIDKELSSHLIHISTDQLYDNAVSNSVSKEHDICLKNYYAFSKYAGELVAAKINATILRVNFFGKSSVEGRNSFSDWLVQSAITQQQINLFKDVYFSPLSIKTLSIAIQQILNKSISGVYNLGSSSGISKADFALMLYDILGFSTNNMTLVNYKSVDHQVVRPSNMQMDSSLFEETYGIKLPSIQEEIQFMKLEYQEICAL